jgi:PII-like signaling protein
MLSRGPAKKVTIYLNEDTQHHIEALHESILTFLLHKGVAGATAFRATAGFGSHRLMHTRKVEVLAEHLPIIVEFVESAEKVEELLPTLYEMVTDGLVEVQDTNIVKIARKEKKAEPKQPHERRSGTAKLMRVFLGEADRWHDEPLYDAIVKRLRMMEVSGATVYRGILGYGAKGHTHKQGLLHLSRDLPVMISVVDAPEKIVEAAAAIESMLVDGLIVLSDVEMTRLVRSAPVDAAASAGTPPVQREPAL